MAATAAMRDVLRRMINEPTTTTYSDDTLDDYIEKYPLIDEQGEEPYEWDDSTSPPTAEENTDWIDTYDLNAAAADIWQEKAAALSPRFDVTTDGASMRRSQLWEMAMKMEGHYRSLRAPHSRKVRRPYGTIAVRPSPTQDDRPWIGNLPEEDND